MLKLSSPQKKRIGLFLYHWKIRKGIFVFLNKNQNNAVKKDEHQGTHERSIIVHVKNEQKNSMQELRCEEECADVEKFFKIQHFNDQKETDVETRDNAKDGLLTEGSEEVWWPFW